MKFVVVCQPKNRMGLPSTANRTSCVIICISHSKRFGSFTQCTMENNESDTIIQRVCDTPAGDSAKTLWCSSISCRIEWDIMVLRTLTDHMIHVNAYGTAFFSYFNVYQVEYIAEQFAVFLEDSLQKTVCEDYGDLYHEKWNRNEDVWISATIKIFVPHNWAMLSK